MSGNRLNVKNFGVQSLVQIVGVNLPVRSVPAHLPIDQQKDLRTFVPDAEFLGHPVGEIACTLHHYQSRRFAFVRRKKAAEFLIGIGRNGTGNRMFENPAVAAAQQKSGQFVLRLRLVKTGRELAWMHARSQIGNGCVTKSRTQQAHHHDIDEDICSCHNRH